MIWPAITTKKGAFCQQFRIKLQKQNINVCIKLYEAIKIEGKSKFCVWEQQTLEFYEGYQVLVLINSWKYLNLGIGQLSPVQPVSVFDIQMFLTVLTKLWRKESAEKNPLV